MQCTVVYSAVQCTVHNGVELGAICMTQHRADTVLRGREGPRRDRWHSLILLSSGSSSPPQDHFPRDLATCQLLADCHTQQQLASNQQTVTLTGNMPATSRLSNSVETCHLPTSLKNCQKIADCHTQQQLTSIQQTFIITRNLPAISRLSYSLAT